MTRKKEKKKIVTSCDSRMNVESSTLDVIWSKKCLQIEYIPDLRSHFCEIELD